MWNPRTIELLRTWLKGKHTAMNKPLTELITTHVKYWLGQYCREVNNVKIVRNINEDSINGPTPSSADHQVGKENFEYSTPTSEVKPQGQVQHSVSRSVSSKANPSGSKVHAQENIVSSIPPVPQEPPVPEDEWNKAGEALTPKPKEPGEFSLVVEGNLELLKEKIEYHGYHITLSQQNQFQPTLDIVQDDKGMTIIVDLPGFRYDDEDDDAEKNLKESSESMPYAGGTVSVTIDRAIRNVVISGKRVLCTPKILVESDGNFAFGPIINYKQRNDCERTYGHFERRVPIPDKYELDSDPFFTLEEGQGIIFLKTAKKNKKVKPVRLRAKK
eukprot:TRINITY_DN2685_c0_g1_i3.p1 TRINITY_DN2685_c0_g1~~TRINITY_DN2685_c0_g1_i3.p1  ORF type:complete len:330 (+),score=75.54 TRINITY_DN2685_c0_g1_i3:1147-2136(+)